MVRFYGLKDVSPLRKLTFLLVSKIIMSYCGLQGMTDFQYLCSYLHLNIVGGKAIPQSSFTSAASCVEWVVNEPHTLTRAWCTDLIQFVNRNPLDGKVGLLLYL